MISLLLPGPIVDSILVGGARGYQTPPKRPLIGVIETFTRVWLRRCVQETSQPEVLGLQKAARLIELGASDLLLSCEALGGARRN